ncbi:MAG: hypothetical protein KGO50_01360 [Myxococcales bacterium]|nr:hypothetical protein [Myxococcales bacterium]
MTCVLSMPPTWRAVLQAIVERLGDELAVATAQVNIARDEATSEQSKAENKYDTRATEASYLAGAQNRRQLDLQKNLALFERLRASIPVARDAIDGPCLVAVRDGDGEEAWLFLGPAAGGTRVEVCGVAVVVVTPQAPQGRALMGAGVDDEVVVTDTGRRLTVVRIDSGA